MPKTHTKESFFAKSEKHPNGCWIYTGYVNPLSGYGIIGYNYSVLRAHRLAYILTHGEIPNDLFVCHRCDNRLCINPDHLFLGTHQDNMDDMVSKGRYKSFNSTKTHCAQGHEYTPENTKYYGNKRICIKCAKTWKIRSLSNKAIKK